MPSFAARRLRARWMLAGDLVHLLRHALHARGLTVGAVVWACVSLTVWTALVVALLTALVLHARGLI